MTGQAIERVGVPCGLGRPLDESGKTPGSPTESEGENSVKVGSDRSGDDGVVLLGSSDIPDIGAPEVSPCTRV